ncbi:MAG TPA: tryptophan 2,3-dioxygenase family protein [Baekduia sp.]|nr:tryptophan 2,3-dioxygenase family protein [Baekduia sp.]
MRDDQQTTAVQDLRTWTDHGDPARFPFESVAAALQRTGKHVPDRHLIALLAGVRDRLPRHGNGLLERFLHVVLDKHDGRYANPTYLALDLLPIAWRDQPTPDPAQAARQRDRVVVLLLADALRFELDAAEGRHDLSPEMRPNVRLLGKRCRHGLRAARPALARLGLDGGAAVADPVDAARRMCRAVEADATPAERRMLALTVLPVSRVHDERLFLRVLQAYELTFAAMAVSLQAAIADVGAGRTSGAARRVGDAERQLREAAPLFSLIGTMQPEAFLTFRQSTDGASAIQSRSYKLLESLCRRPDAERLDSPAYRSVPEVRERVLAGQADLDAAVAAAGGAAEVAAAMAGLEDALGAWRRTHHSLAVKMLGARRGTGATAGVPYLAAAREIPVFSAAAPALQAA